MKNPGSMLIKIGTLFTFAVLITSCASDQIRSPKPRSDWSRGLQVGSSDVLTQPDLFIDGDATAHIIWIADVGGKMGTIGYSQVTADGELVLKTALSVQESHLRGVSFRDLKDTLEVCWTSDAGVRCSRLDEGTLTELEPYTLIPTPPEILAYSLAGEDYAWITENGDLYLVRPGQIPEEISGFATNLHLSRQGDTLLLAWMEAPTEGETTIWVQTVGDDGTTNSTQVDRIPAGVLSGIRYRGFGASIVEEDICLVYGIEYTHGLEGGTAFAEFFCLDQESLRPTTADRIEITVTSELNYNPYEGPYALDRLAEIDLPVSDFTYMPSTLNARGNHLALVVSTPAEIRYRIRQQIAFLILEDGEFLGYQPVSATNSTSINPALATDDNGNLYVTWLERAAGIHIFFSSTRSDVAESLDQVNASEIASTLIGVSVELATGLFLLPFTIFWIGFAMVGLFVTSRFVRFIGFENWSDTVGFVVGVVLLWLAKLLFMPQILTYVPLSSWLPELSPQVAIAYKLFIMIFIFAASLFTASRLSKRWDVDSATLRFGLFAIIDVFLTSLLFGVLLLGAA